MNTDDIANSREYKPHDLLGLRALPLMDNAPAWLADAFASAPFAVVRRAAAPPGFVAVGFRGATRSQRYGAFVERERVLSALSPEDLAGRQASFERRTLAAFAALREIADSACFRSLLWGPTGSVGFELATGRPMVAQTSDLDLLVRTPTPLARSKARSLRERLQSIERGLGLRIDTQLETPMGGIALNEWAEDTPRVMARSAHGPRLLDDPWASVDSRFEANL